MLGTLLGAGARVATRAAIQSHRDGQARVASLRQQIQNFPFTLTPKLCDAALYHTTNRRGSRARAARSPATSARASTTRSIAFFARQVPPGQCSTRAPARHTA